MRSLNSNLPVVFKPLPLVRYKLGYSFQVVLEGSSLPYAPLEGQQLGVLVHAIHQLGVFQRVKGDGGSNAGVVVQLWCAQDPLVVSPEEHGGLV